MKLLRPVVFMVLMVMLVGVAAAEDIDPYLYLTTEFHKTSGCGILNCAVSEATKNLTTNLTFQPQYANQDHNLLNDSGGTITEFIVTFTAASGKSFSSSYSDASFNCVTGTNLGGFSCTHYPTAFGPFPLTTVAFRFYGGTINPGTVFNFVTGPTGSPSTWIDGTFSVQYKTPEPASMVLLGSGLLALGFLRRRK